ncbi:hypothetical protein OC25_26470 [Pedobacter kyungheensis]|uniref:Uncharacterized protein n=1 Tax=Pedobacter kyungheensis TaxID=1069985 RepID=A0A0C1CV14_9SPHI|nr:hypothetical protein [Pedobacter kyungheensis]KIA88106.1 hypothetical protein OC25_26470 [Pedobacter kyungheensis]
MQPIQDKDFDQLFKNAFDDAEIAPSRDLWSNIESEIEPKKKRIIPIYWLSAAAVLLVVAAGILVYQQQNVNPKQLTSYVAPKVQKPVVAEQPVKDLVITPVKPIEKVEVVLPVSNKPVTSLAKTNLKKVARPVEKQKIVTAPEVLKQETVIAKTEEPKKDIKTKIEEAILQPENKTVIAANPAAVKIDEPINDNDEQSTKSIRNVGDVVNLIVNKVDKRKDKFIQFRTDDDDSSLSSINIGPFKIGKRKK